MDLNQFVQDATRTESRIESVNTNVNLLVSALVMAIAAGEILDQIKKNVFYGRPINMGKVEGALRDSILSAECVEIDVPNGVVENIDPRVFHAIVGIITESAELADHLLKVITGEVPFDAVNTGEEFGDIDWYKAIGADAMGLSLEQILTTVISKLKLRYPEKFTSENAVNRNLTAERAVLEQGIE